MIRIMRAMVCPSLAANSHFGLPTVRKDARQSAGGGDLLTHLCCVSSYIAFVNSMVLTLSVVDVAVAWRGNWYGQFGEVKIF